VGPCLGLLKLADVKAHYSDDRIGALGGGSQPESIGRSGVALFEACHAGRRNPSRCEPCVKVHEKSVWKPSAKSSERRDWGLAPPAQF